MVITNLLLERKAFFADVSREGIGEDVAEAVEEIIRETGKELDIGCSPPL